MLRITLVFLLVAGVVSAADSPLVALAKRTNRQASKTRVITNESLAASKGRVAIASGSPRVPTLRPTPQPQAPRKAPATETAAPTLDYPASSARNIEPSSSAQNVNPQSSAGTINPTSGARTITPQNTSGTIEPQSTAKNIPPQAVPPQNGTPPQ